MKICIILAIKSEVCQDHEVSGDPKHTLYCSISKKPGGMGADVAKIEGTVMDLKINWPVYCNPSVDKEQFWVI
jgi:hypothetical protein